MGSAIVIEEIFIASQEQVWQAITEKDQMKIWYFDIPDFTLQEGIIFNFYEPGERKQFHHRCEIRQVIPKKRFQHTWTHPEHSKGESLLTWDLIPDGVLTKVVLTHDGLENLADAGPEFARENYEAGWKSIITDSLRRFLED